MKTCEFRGKSLRYAGIAAVASVLLLGSASVFGADTLPVSATVAKTCVFDSATAFTFDPYDPITQTTDLTKSMNAIKVKCTKGLKYRIALGKGGADTYSPREMDNGIDKLQYNIYTSNLYTSIWGDPTADATTSYKDAANPATSAAVQDVMVDGKIFGNQTGVSGGVYNDSLAVTVSVVP